MARYELYATEEAHESTEELGGLVAFTDSSRVAARWQDDGGQVIDREE